jgi:beta-lactamase superfamily II metal-dependent hydrolase
MDGDSDERPRELFGFVDSVHFNNPLDGYARLVLHLDCVNQEAFGQSFDAVRDEQNLALVRVITTRRALTRHFNIQSLKDGQWVALRVERKRGMPRAWVLPASEDYRLGRPTNVVSMRLLPYRDPVEQKLSAVCQFMQAPAQPVSLSTAFRQHAARLTGKLRIQALDVGQASSAVFLVDGSPIGFFDVGAPIWFNQRSISSSYKPPSVSKGFVMLSHWDFDHIDQARRFPQLRTLDWFAPDQPVGPNTVKLQEKIGSRLTFIHGSATFHHRIHMAPGTSTDPKDRNGTGYAMRVEQDGEVALLLGDSDYGHVQAHLLAGATAMTIPHHGGRGSSPNAPAGGSSIAIASYGSPNSYKHPHEPHLHEHARLGWKVARTANHSPSGVPRGNRWLL